MQPIRSVSHDLSPWAPSILGLALYALLVLTLLALMFFLAAWLGEKSESHEKTRPYECGIVPTGPARFRYPVPFYRVAVFFLIFDVEAAFIFSWAIAFEELGWPGWLQIFFFIFVLLISLSYIWKKGGLEWGPTASKSRLPPKG